MTVFWRDTMSVGNDAIDHDHRYLVCYLNTVELALQNPEEKEPILVSLEQLSNYAGEHFLREEQIQLKIHYPHLGDHRKEHQELLSQLNSLAHKVRFVYGLEELKQRHEEIVSFLRHWLLDHVLDSDMLLKPYLRKFGPALR